MGEGASEAQCPGPRPTAMGTPGSPGPCRQRNPGVLPGSAVWSLGLAAALSLSSNRPGGWGPAQVALSLCASVSSLGKGGQKSTGCQEALGVEAGTAGSPASTGAQTAHGLWGRPAKTGRPSVTDTSPVSRGLLALCPAHSLPLNCSQSPRGTAGWA